MRSEATDDEPALSAIAARHGFGIEATRSMRDAVMRGGGRMAQFRHPEFSGQGQWMAGGMTMISDLSDRNLKARVDGLCSELVALVARHAAAATDEAARTPVPSHPDQSLPTGTGWPADLGQPSASGSQNGSRYAVFDAAHRLAIEQDGRTVVYDTLDHRIVGVSQQQGLDGAMRFTSRDGIVDIERLPRVPVGGPAPADAPIPAGVDDIPAMIERLADLAARGILTPAEFAAKKAELLARI